MHTQPRYRAPALERGLEIIELLVSASSPMNLTNICDRLDRNPNELFRMLQVLEKRRFIMRGDATRGYEVTGKIFQLATAHGPGPAFPASVVASLRELSDSVSQSCYLAVASGVEAVVIDRIESLGDVALSVSLGFRRHVAEMPAGVVLFAFQPREARLHWLEQMEMPGDAKAAFLARADRARHSGYLEEDSSFVPGITDLCAPVMQQGCAIAAITIPFVQTNSQTLDREQVTLELCKAAYKISEIAERA
jgi:DNA-binding IclR family transcriptional regulator